MEMKFFRKLTTAEKGQAEKVIIKGTKEDIFEYAYNLGAKHQIERMVKEMTEFANTR